MFILAPIVKANWQVLRLGFCQVIYAKYMLGHPVGCGVNALLRPVWVIVPNTDFFIAPNR
jgi:hypothetical protein